jgi:hypothetical protein
MIDTQTRRAGGGAATTERSHRYGQFDPPRSPRPPLVPRPRPRHAQATLRFATGVALVIALAAALVTVQGLTQASRSHARIAALQADVNSLKQRVRTDERAAAADRRHESAVTAQAASVGRALQHVNWQVASLPTETEVAHLRGGLATYAACIPELQREIRRLGIAWRIDPSKPREDYFRAFTAATISRSCSAALGGR